MILLQFTVGVELFLFYITLLIGGIALSGFPIASIIDNKEKLTLQKATLIFIGAACIVVFFLTLPGCEAIFKSWCGFFQHLWRIE